MLMWKIWWRKTHKLTKKGGERIIYVELNSTVVKQLLSFGNDMETLTTAQHVHRTYFPSIWNVMCSSARMCMCGVAFVATAATASTFRTHTRAGANTFCMQTFSFYPTSISTNSICYRYFRQANKWHGKRRAKKDFKWKQAKYFWSSDFSDGIGDALLVNVFLRLQWICSMSESNSARIIIFLRWRVRARVCVWVFVFFSLRALNRIIKWEMTNNGIQKASISKGVCRHAVHKYKMHIHTLNRIKYNHIPSGWHEIMTFPSTNHTTPYSEVFEISLRLICKTIKLCMQFDFSNNDNTWETKWFWLPINIFFSEFIWKIKIIY